MSMVETVLTSQQLREISIINKDLQLTLRNLNLYGLYRGKGWLLFGKFQKYLVGQLNYSQNLGKLESCKTTPDHSLQNHSLDAVRVKELVSGKFLFNYHINTYNINILELQFQSYFKPVRLYCSSDWHDASYLLQRSQDYCCNMTITWPL